MFASNSSQVSSDATYVEDIFSTYLYTGNGSSQTITNNIDLSGKGGLVWIKSRSNAIVNALYDTNRGAGYHLVSNWTDGQAYFATELNAFNSNGFGVGSDSYVNQNNATYASWTFRKQPKFFDIVTYTGNGVARTIAHNLGSVPGCMIIKRLDDASNWPVYHRSNLANDSLFLSAPDTTVPNRTYWNNTRPTSTVFSLGDDVIVNQNGGTYVAYLFAHDAGGFGLTGTDNVISCGSFVSTGANQRVDINLGYQPQWVLVKRTDNSGNWNLLDSMRGFPAVNVESSNDPTSKVLWPNLSNAESDFSIALRTNGFSMPGGQFSAAGETYIYIAIRRGPMKTPTSGTSVFAPVTRTAPSTTVTSNTNPDLLVALNRTGTYAKAWLDKLRGKIGYIASSDTGAEYTGATATLTDWGNTGVKYNSSAGGPANDSGVTYVDYYFTRAPGFFDEVCYTGTGSNTTQTHNLGVVPELIIVKRRDTTGAWDTYSAALANTEYMVLNTTAAKATGATRWNSTTPTSSVFSIGTSTTVNASGGTYVAYLFATVAGVSKVGTYTGTGTTLQIDCGFTGGARFVMIKRTDSTGGWYVWDTARGIIAGNDPFSFLNTTAAETTNTDYIDAYSAGFEISSTAPAAINASGGTFIYLAIS